MRDRQVRVQTTKDDIVGYEHYISAKLVRVHIGVGDQDVNGDFIESANQSYESVDIVDIRYDELMSEEKDKDGKIIKPGGVFRKDDLWGQIDKLRQARELMIQLNGVRG